MIYNYAWYKEAVVEEPKGHQGNMSPKPFTLKYACNM